MANDLVKQRSSLRIYMIQLVPGTDKQSKLDFRQFGQTAEKQYFFKYSANFEMLIRLINFACTHSILLQLSDGFRSWAYQLRTSSIGRYSASHNNFALPSLTHFCPTSRRHTEKPKLYRTCIRTFLPQQKQRIKSYALGKII